MAVNVRVEARRSQSPNRGDRYQDGIRLIRTFRKVCEEAGVQQEYNERRFFVSKGEQRRRKKQARRRQAQKEGSSGA